MFVENENPVTEEVTENVEEQATEELVDGTKEVDSNLVEKNTSEEPKGKFYTDEEFDKIIQGKLARQERKLRKNYDKKYGRLENVLMAGMEDNDIDSITDKLSDFYTKEGKTIPNTPHYSERDREYLAERDAEDIIAAGYDEIKSEVDRLSNIGLDKMTIEDKIIFKKLAQERTRIEDEKELASIGVTKVDKEFEEFSKKLNPNLSIKEKYEMYSKFKPKPEVEPIGSMKNTKVNKVKDHYTMDEISRLTDEELDDPKVWEAVQKSLTNS